MVGVCFGLSFNVEERLRLRESFYFIHLEAATASAFCAEITSDDATTVVFFQSTSRYG